MRISVLCPDLSDNCLGRAYLLAKILERNHEGEIVGPMTGDNIWKPVREDYTYRSVEMNWFILDLPLKYSRISKQISGDIVYASKPRLGSYGIGLLHALQKQKPLILDIDDWEAGLKFNESDHKLVSYLRALPEMVHWNSLVYLRLMERLHRKADELTVSNRFLQTRFGGRLIPHVRDTDIFDPAKYNTEEIRSELNIPQNETVVLFSGTPRPHKGVDDLITAMEQVDGPARLLIVGAHQSDYVDKLRSLAGNQVHFYPQQPFSELPKWIAAADIFVIPQQQTPGSEGQLPAKLFDAMAMGKPIIATDVSDISHILSDCGRIVEPGQPKEIAAAINEMLNNPETREEWGSKARERCIMKYSIDAMAPKLEEIINRVS